MEGKHVVILEDEAPVREMLEKVLVSAGYRVTATGDGPSALKAIRADPPDIVVSDLSMPGIDGYQVIQLLKRSLTFEAPIIVVSGRTKPKDKENAMNAGADVFLEKPVDRETLLAEVEKQLAQQALPTTGAAHDGKLILVLEDDRATLAMLERLLRNAGYRVKGMRNGDEAFGFVREKYPDLVISDLVVPGTPGLDLIPKLRNELAYPGPVVVISGRSQDSVEDAALRAGADSFLPKPLSKQLLLHHIANLLDGRKAP